MHTIDPSWSGDPLLLETCRREAKTAQTSDGFKAWTQRCVRPLLPHGALACAHGPNNSAGVSVNFVLTVDYPLAHFREIRDASGQMESPLTHCWYEQQSPVFFDADHQPNSFGFSRGGA